MTEMHDVVEMLLTRMKDYPEDFVDDPNEIYGRQKDNKWKQALRLIGSVVAPHEKEALDIRIEEAKRAVYMGAALKTIMSDEVEEEVINSKPSYNPFTTTGVSQSLLMNNSIAMDKTLVEMEARVKAQEAQMQRQYAMNTYAGSAAGSALG